MKKLQNTALIMLLLLVFGQLHSQTAKEILKKAEDKFRGNSSFIELKMTIVRPDWTREMTMKSWSVGESRSLILITGPARDKGTVFLKRDREIWNWVPSIERTVKMPPSMMSQSWMGSDFKNDDLVRESSVIKDYTHEIVGNETIEGRECWKLELIPTEEAAVVWGKVVIWVSKKDYLQLKSEFYDEDEELVNTMLFTNIKEMDGRVIPSKMTMIPEEEEGHKTIMEYLNADFDIKIEDSFFSIQNMKKVH